jgi:hypothetical protein
VKRAAVQLNVNEAEQPATEVVQFVTGTVLEYADWVNNSCWLSACFAALRSGPYHNAVPCVTPQLMRCLSQSESKARDKFWTLLSGISEQVPRKEQNSFFSALVAAITAVSSSIAAAKVSYMLTCSMCQTRKYKEFDAEDGCCLMNWAEYLSFDVSNQGHPQPCDLRRPCYNAFCQSHDPQVLQASTVHTVVAAVDHDAAYPLPQFMLIGIGRDK